MTQVGRDPPTLREVCGDIAAQTEVLTLFSKKHIFKLCNNFCSAPQRTRVTKAQNLPKANFSNQSKNYKSNVLHIKHYNPFNQ